MKIFAIILVALICMMIIWHLNERKQQHKVHHSKHMSAVVMDSDMRALHYRDPVTLYDDVSKKYLNITDKCNEISLTPNTLCLKWETKKAPFQYSTFILYISNINGGKIDIRTPVLLYAPYLNMWYSDTTTGNLTKIEPNKFITINNNICTANNNLYDGMEYSLVSSDSNAILKGKNIIFNKINFD